MLVLSAEESGSSLRKAGCHSGSRNISQASTVALPLLSPLLHGRSVVMSNALARPGVLNVKRVRVRVRVRLRFSTCHQRVTPDLADKILIARGTSLSTCTVPDVLRPVPLSVIWLQIPRRK